MEAYNNGLPRRQAGQSFFEVIVALGLISIVLITLVTMGSASIKASTFARNQTQANRYTQQAVEWLTGEKTASWATFKTHATSITWCLDSLWWQKPNPCGSSDIISGTIYKRSVTFTIIDPSTIQADISTVWVDAQGSHSVPASTIFTNWK